MVARSDDAAMEIGPLVAPVESAQLMLLPDLVPYRQGLGRNGHAMKRVPSELIAALSKMP